MKAIILAAGRGVRLGSYTKNLPKCMLNVGGYSIIQRVKGRDKINGEEITVQ